MLLDGTEFHGEPTLGSDLLANTIDFTRHGQARQTRWGFRSLRREGFISIKAGNSRRGVTTTAIMNVPKKPLRVSLPQSPVSTQMRM